MSWISWWFPASVHSASREKKKENALMWAEWLWSQNYTTKERKLNLRCTYEIVYSRVICFCPFQILQAMKKSLNSREDYNLTHTKRLSAPTERLRQTVAFGRQKKNRKIDGSSEKDYKHVLKGHINLVLRRWSDVVKEHVYEMWQIAVEDQVVLLFTRKLKHDHNLTFTIFHC